TRARRPHAARALLPVRERARGARVRRVPQERFDDIKAAAEATTSTGRLQDIERYSARRMLYTRFNYTTGDAAGQNLTGKATQAACHWITANYPDVEQFFLESNFATATGRDACAPEGDSTPRAALSASRGRSPASRCRARAPRPPPVRRRAARTGAWPAAGRRRRRR